MSEQEPYLDKVIHYGNKIIMQGDYGKATFMLEEELFREIGFSNAIGYKQKVSHVESLGWEYSENSNMWCRVENC